MKTFLPTTLIATLALSAANAASILFGSATNISGDLDVSTSGTFVMAHHFTQAVTVNSVPFAAFPITNFTPTATVGAQSITSADNNLFSANWFGSTSAPFSNLSTDYKALLTSLVTNAYAMPITLTLGGLSIGQLYQVQLWSSQSTSGSGTVSLLAGNSVNLNINVGGQNGGLGQFVTGTFTADATTQNIGILMDTAAPSINAFQVRAIPELSSSLALLASSILLIRRRRRC